MNPARSLAPAIVSGDLQAIGIYLVGPVIGAVAAAIVYRYLRMSRPYTFKSLEGQAVIASR